MITLVPPCLPGFWRDARRVGGKERRNWKMTKNKTKNKTNTGWTDNEA